MRSTSREPSVRRGTTPDRPSVSYPLFGNRSIPSQNPLESPQIDPKSRYSISYVPRLSEHHIDTGKTLMEAQFKVILLSCEVERLSVLNYKLVKENEVLHIQSDKDARQKDLETKIAIVLAENEKLNQIIDEITGNYPQDNDDSRVQELLRDLDEWKQKCSILESTQHLNDAGKREKALVQENEMRERETHALRERLNDALNKIIQYEGALKGCNDEITRLNKVIKEMEEALSHAHGIDYHPEQEKIKRAGTGVNAEKNKALAEEILRLRNENQLLKPEAEKCKELQIQVAQLNEDYAKLVEAIKAKSAECDQYRASSNQYQNDNKRLLEALQKTQADNDNLRKLLDQLRQNQGGNSDELNRKIKILSEDNNALSTENMDLRKKITELLDANRIIDELNNRIKAMNVDNQKIAENLTDKIRENERLYQKIRDLQESGRQLEDLKTKLLLLSQENERLNILIADRSRENDELKQKIQELLKTAANAEHLAQRVKVLVDQIQRTQENLDGKVLENDKLNKKIEELEKQYGDLEMYKRQIITLNQDIEIYKKRISDLEIMSLKIKDMADEIQRLKNALALKNQEIIDLNNYIAELEKQRNEQTALQEENKKLKAMVATKMGEIDDVCKTLAQMQASQGNVVNDLNAKIKNFMSVVNSS